MMIGKAKDGFLSYLNPGEEEKMALDIIERCEIGCVSITVVDDDGTLMDALWGGLKRAVERKNTDLCDDILGSIRYIDSERMKCDDYFEK